MTEPIKRKRGRPRIDRPLQGKKRQLGRPSLHTQAFDALRNMIVRGELAAGERIPETAICETLGLSRTPLREALKLLAAEGLVELRPNQGARISPIHADQINQLFEAVSGIERIAAELAAIRLDVHEIKHLKELQTRMEAYYEADMRDEYFALNQEIHRLIVAGSKNDVLTATHAWLLSRAERARYLALDVHERWTQSVEEHRAILAALEARDSERAGRLLHEHVAHTGNAVTATLRNAEAVRDAAE
jgi:DNA-binding GntR family transcriptional regulator